MYPLISGIVLGGKQRLSTARALLLTFIYVQGMALTYGAGSGGCRRRVTVPGGATAPVRAHGLAIVFTLLAMSMFDLFTLQLPSSLQTSHADEQSPTGAAHGGVFIMGGDCQTDLFTMHHCTA